VSAYLFHEMTHVALSPLRAHEMTHVALSPLRAVAATTKLCFDNTFNPAAHSSFGRSVSAACELLERSTRRYEKPAFSIPALTIGAEVVTVTEHVVWARPFCNLIP
jgi:poly(3-hydroxybutyrate) depolymerase